MQVVLCVLLVVLHGDDELLVLNTQACWLGTYVCNAYGYSCRVVHSCFAMLLFVCSNTVLC